MDKTVLITRKRVRKLKNPVLLTGLPGIGLIGRTVVMYLIDNLKGEHIADMYSPHFPHEAIMGEDGRLYLLSNSFYRIKLKNRDIIGIVGDVQPATTVGQYEVAGKILDYAEKLGVKEIITIGGYSVGKIVKNGRIFGVANALFPIKSMKKLGVSFGEVGCCGRSRRYTALPCRVEEGSVCSSPWRNPWRLCRCHIR